MYLRVGGGGGEGGEKAVLPSSSQHVRRVVALDVVRLLEAVDGLRVLLQVHIAQALVVPDLPVAESELHSLRVPAPSAREE
jgi:hypothetical protein